MAGEREAVSMATLLAASVLVFGEHWLFPLYPTPLSEERGRRAGGGAQRGGC